jgi:hypothetical protein
VILGVSDKSGGAHHLSEATNGPQYKVAIQNGKPVARFDGANDLLAATIDADASNTMFFAARKRSAAVAGVQSMSNLTAVRLMSATTNWAPQTITMTDAISNGVPFPGLTDVQTAAIYGVRMTSASILELIGGNGGASISINPHDNWGTGTALQLGCASGPSSFGDYDIFEILRYGSVLSDADFNKVGRYLATKWGTSWSDVYDPGFPLKVAGIVAWYDFQDASTLFLDTARTVPITGDDDQVIKGVTDKSGLGQHLTNATNGLVYKRAGQNGRPVARTTFAGGEHDDTASADIIPSGNVPPFTVVLVAAKNSDNTNTSMLGRASRWTLGVGTISTHFRFTTNGIQSYDFNPGWPDPDLHVQRVLFDSLSDVTLWKDGVSQGTVAGAANPAPGASPLTVGVGVANGDFDIAEVIVYHGSISDAAAVEDYLQAKWGTP